MSVAGNPQFLIAFLFEDDKFLIKFLIIFYATLDFFNTKCYCLPSNRIKPVGVTSTEYMHQNMD